MQQHMKRSFQTISHYITLKILLSVDYIHSFYFSSFYFEIQMKFKLECDRLIEINLNVQVTDFKKKIEHF